MRKPSLYLALTTCNHQKHIFMKKRKKEERTFRQSETSLPASHFARSVTLMLGFKSIFVSWKCYWKCYSSFLASQVKKLVVQDPKKRLSTQQALQHPWVTGKAVNFTHMDTAQKKLLEFNARRKLKVWGFWLNYTFSSRFYPSKAYCIIFDTHISKATKCLTWLSGSSALSMCPVALCVTLARCLHVHVYFVVKNGYRILLSKCKK